MAKRTTTSTHSRKTTPAKTVSTPMRNSAIPRSTSPTNRGFGNNGGGGTAMASGRQVTHEMIAKRAYEIWKSGKGGSQYDNWLRAERELRSEMR